MNRPEQHIHLVVADHLRWRAAAGVFWMHYPSGGYRTPIEAKILQALGAKPGVPDVLAVREGRLYGLELKAEGGRLSPVQIDCHDALRAAGAEVAVAIGVDEALAQLREWRLLKNNVTNARSTSAR
jgi:hypothetical protein